MPHLSCPDRGGTREQYQLLKPELTDRLQELYRQLRELLESRGYTPSIKYRIKGFDNYFDKVSKLLRQKPQSRPLISDLLGLRVICPFLEDLDQIEQLILANFEVVELEHKGERHSFREFGYDSVHLLIRLDDWPGELPYAEPFCELQLRTILQDAWAEVEHELVYKSDLGFPNESIKRKLASLNASLALSDLIFQEIRDYQKELRQRGIKRRQSIEELLNNSRSLEIANLGGFEFSEQEEDPLPELDTEASPRGLEKSMFKALEAHSNKNFSLAIQIYGRILRMKLEAPIRSLVYNHRGMALFALADYQKAIEDFSKAVQYNGENARAWCNRGLVCRVLGRYDQSLEDYQRAIQIDTAPFEGYWGRAQTCYEMQLYSRALSDCEKVLSLQADFIPAKELEKTIRRQMF